jgi:hypothetical protein
MRIGEPNKKKPLGLAPSGSLFMVSKGFWEVLKPFFQKGFQAG